MSYDNIFSISKEKKEKYSGTSLIISKIINKLHSCVPEFLSLEEKLTHIKDLSNALSSTDIDGDNGHSIKMQAEELSFCVDDIRQKMNETYAQILSNEKAMKQLMLNDSVLSNLAVPKAEECGDSNIPWDVLKKNVIEDQTIEDILKEISLLNPIPNENNNLSDKEKNIWEKISNLWKE